MTTFVPTPEQEAIISYPPVPLRVVAGAGTGKTTTIVERLAAGVGAGIDPTRALGITFTNKASDELRSHLRTAIGDRSDGREVEVATYHGFASAILDEFGAFVGYEPSASLMDDGHRTELAYRILRDLDSTDLDLSALPRRREELLSMSDAIASNLTSTDDVIANAPPDPSDVWTKRMSLARAAEAFAVEKHRLGFFEYSDLIRLAVDIVETFPHVADQISRRYDTVLLDEYQDTDPAQRRLLTAVFAHGVAVTAVGDADQTIYEWRGASLENFSRFPQHFPRTDMQPTETLPLSVNRRSDTLILDLANKIRGCFPRIDGSKPLAPGPDAKPGAVAVGWFPTDKKESSWIASQILQRHAAGKDWSDMAILCRKRTAIPTIVAELRSNDIPYSVSSMGELLSVPEVADLLAWLKVLSDPGDETSLLRIWMGGKFRIGMHDISRLSRWCGTDDQRDLGAALGHLDEVEGLSIAGRQRLENYAATHSYLYANAQVLSVPATVNLTIDRLGFWDEVAALSPTAAATIRVNIGRFTMIAQSWRPLDGTPTLTAFLRYIDALNDAPAAEELDSAADLTDSVVQVITVHSAKGLEWPVVFLPSLGEGTFPSRVHTLDNPDNIATSLPYELRLDAASFLEASLADNSIDRNNILRARHADSEWRLAYVAATRAKHDLVLTGHVWDNDVTTPRSPSPLLMIARDLDSSTMGPWNMEPGSKPEPVPYASPVLPPDPHFDSDWASELRNRIRNPDWIATEYPDIVDDVKDASNQLVMKIADLRVPQAEKRVDTFSTSVTNLVALAQCPLKFKWIHHERLPRRPGVAARLGTEFHRKVELHNLGVVALQDPAVRGLDPGNEEGGATTTPHLDPWDAFENSRFAPMRPRFAEAPFVLEIGQGTVRGKIDAIYDDADGVWEVVDYKSGRRKDDDALSVQLEAYALAVADGAVASEIPEEMSVTFAYFGGGICDEETTRVDDRWMRSARDHVEGLMTSAETGPFEPTPSAACRHCDFLHLCKAGQAELER